MKIDADIAPQGAVWAIIILGHRSAAITEVYAELDQQKAMEAIVRGGDVSIQ